MRIALGQHTNSLRYLKAVEKASHRFDLDGKAAEELTDEHRKHAATVLRERFKKEADQRKAHRLATEAAEAAEDAERLRTEKLNQLAAKFGALGDCWVASIDRARNFHFSQIRCANGTVEALPPAKKQK